MESLEVEIHAATDLGNIRIINEDNYLLLQLSTSEFWTKSTDSNEILIQSQKLEIDEHGIVLAVSDGCGGVSAGELPSQMVVGTIKGMLTGEVSNNNPSFDKGTLIEKLYAAALYGNTLVLTEGVTNPQFNGMGATLTAAGITPESVDFLQVGDSRGYLIRKSKIYRITKDQTLINQLIDAGQAKPEEAETHPLRNVILQTMGAQNEIYPVAVRLIPQRDDILLFCTDGLSNKLRDGEDMLRIIQDNLNDLKNACRVLIEEANIRGGEDNVTVILAKFSGTNLIESTDEPVVIYPLVFDETTDKKTTEIL